MIDLHWTTLVAGAASHVLGVDYQTVLWSTPLAQTFMAFVIHAQLNGAKVQRPVERVPIYKRASWRKVVNGDK